MKFLASIIALSFVVSCGNDKKDKSNNELSQNPYQASTVTAYYNPGSQRQQQVYYEGRWYSISPASQQAYTEFNQVYQQAAQDYQQGAGQYALTIVGNVAVYRVQLTGSIGGNVNTQYPQQQYPQQQYQQQNQNSGAISVQSIKLY